MIKFAKDLARLNSSMNLENSISLLLHCNNRSQDCIPLHRHAASAALTV